jgi:N-methylhydantoinase B
MLHYEFLPDSAGAGRWRGGLGVETRFRFETDTLCSVLGDGLESEDAPAAEGLLGGSDGMRNSLELRFPDGRTYRPGSKELLSVPAGTVWHQRQGGGGGFGEPRERDRDAVRRELRDGLLTTAAAYE